MMHVQMHLKLNEFCCACCQVCMHYICGHEQYATGGLNHILKGLFFSGHNGVSVEIRYVMY